MTNWIGNFIIKTRWAYLFLFLLVTLFLLYEAKDMSLGTSLRGNAPENHPYTKLNDMMAETFGLGNIVTILVEVKEGDIVQPQNLAKVLRITKEVEDLRGVFPYITNSIASRVMKRVYVSHDSTGMTLVAPKFLETVAEEIINNPDKQELQQSYKDWISKNEVLYGRIVSKDMKGTAILVTFRWLEDYKYIFQSIKRISETEEDQNTRVIYAGGPITLGYIQTYLPYIVMLFGAAILISAILLYMFFRMKRGVILPIAAALVSVIWTLGLTRMIGYKFDIMNITIPFLVFSVALSHSIQVMSLYREHLFKGLDTQEASRQTITKLLIPCFVAITADFVGFSLLALLPFGLLRSLVVTSRLGMLSIYFTAIFFIPGVLSLIAVPKTAVLERHVKVTFLEKILGRIGILVTQKKGRLGLCLILMITLIFGAIGAAKLKIGDTHSGTAEFWLNSKPNQMLLKVNEKYLGTELMGIYVHKRITKGEAAYGALWDPKVIADVARLQSKLEQNKDVSYTYSFVDRLKSIRATIFEDPQKYGLPQDLKEASLCFDLLIGGGPPEGTRSILTLDQGQACVYLLLRNHQPSTIRSVLKDIDDFVKFDKTSDAIFEYPGGNVGIYAAIMEEIGKSQVVSIIQVTVAIFCMMAISFLSFRMALVLIVPLLFATLVTYSVLGYLNIGLFIATLPIASVGMGVGIDYGVYIFSRVRNELREGKTVPEAIKTALTTTGRAVTYTVFALTVGVLVLCFSPLRFAAIMGLMLAIVFFSSLLLTVIVLPLLLNMMKAETILKEWNFRKLIRK